MCTPRPRTLCWMLYTALFALSLVSAAPGAHAQTPTCPELADAQERYNNGRFEQVIELVTQCLNRPDVEESERQRAYRLIGLSYIGQDLRDNAREAVRQLVSLVPNFEPDPVNDPPQFIEMVEEAKQVVAERQAEEARLAEEARQAEEALPPAEDEAEETQQAEADRLAEEARQAEAARQAEEARRLEEARRAEEARAEAARTQRSGGGITKWLLIGGAVVGGGVLAAVLLGGGGGDDGGGIPGPPLPPGQ